MLFDRPSIGKHLAVALINTGIEGAFFCPLGHINLISSSVCRCVVFFLTINPSLELYFSKFIFFHHFISYFDFFIETCQLLHRLRQSCSGDIRDIMESATLRTF